MIENLIFQPKIIKDTQITERNPILNCWTFYLYKRIYSKPEKFFRLLKNYYVTGQYDHKTFLKLELFVLRVIARKAFQKSMKNVKIVKTSINNLEIHLAKLKPIGLIGNLTTYQNENYYIHNPSNKIFEPIITQTIIETMNDNGLFFDIGAHAGIYSLFAAKVGFNVISVDANPDICKIIQLNKEINNIKCINILNNAVGNQRKKVFLQGMDPRVGSRLVKPRYKEHSTLLPNVNMVRLDDLVEKYGIPNLVKIDIEGHEVNAIQGAKKIIQKGVTTFIIDIHNHYFASNRVRKRAFLDLFPQNNWYFSTFIDNKEVKINGPDIFNYECVKFMPVRIGATG